MTIAASEHSGFVLELTSRDRGQLLAALLVGLLLVVPLALKVPDVYRRFRAFAQWLLRLVERWSSPGGADLPNPDVGCRSRCTHQSAGPTALSAGHGAVESGLLCRIVGHRAVWAGALATIFLFGQPYALQTLSYSFDSPLMVFAVLLSLAAGACLVLGSGPRSRIAAWRSWCARWPHISLRTLRLDRGVNGVALSLHTSRAAGMEGVGRLGGLSIVGLVDLQIRPI